jgi:hypothetical protein
MSFFCLSIEDIAACSMNFISTCPCFKSSGLRSATVAYWINENEVFVKQTSDPKVNSFHESEYLTRLFMVHRQDFIRPLCKGLCDLKKDIAKDPSCLSKRWTHDYIRVYRNIQFLSRCNQQNGVTWRISFNVAQYSNVNWVTRKLLTFVLTYGNTLERKPGSQQV